MPIQIVNRTPIISHISASIAVVCLFMYTSVVFDYYCRDSELSYIREIGFQSAPPWKAVCVFNVPEDNPLRS